MLDLVRRKTRTKGKTLSLENFDTVSPFSGVFACRNVVVGYHL